MKTDLHHLPERQQQELAKILEILLTEFEAARTRGGGGTCDWRRGGQVLKVILFGSYARNDWVDEPENGYLSDFDLLIVVSHEKLTDIAEYWWAAEDRILRDPEIGRTVNLIVHDLADVNSALARGEYFWADIVRDGVVLHEVPGHALAEPKPKSSRDAFEVAERTFQTRLEDLDLRVETSAQQVANAAAGQHVRKWSAFLLHQSVEAAYACFLLIHTFYFPRSHNIKFLRSLAEDVDRRLAEAWPRESRIDRRRFELLKRAYVEARYSDQYDASVEDLEWLTAAAMRLRDLVAESCKARVAELRENAEQG